MEWIVTKNILDERTDELYEGTYNVKCGNELSIVSRILYGLENIDFTPSRKQQSLPDFARDF